MVKKKAATNSRARLLKIPVTLYLEPEQAAELKALTARTRVPQQDYIREGVDAVLAKYRRK
jgi:Ribbon-helix-helix domain